MKRALSKGVAGHRGGERAETPEERLTLTRRTMDLLESWGLGARDIIQILSLPETVKVRAVARFRDDEPFPDEPAVNRRLAYLMRIEEALHTDLAQ